MPRDGRGGYAQAMARHFIFPVLALALTAAAPPSGPVKVGPPDALAQFRGAMVSVSGGSCSEVDKRRVAELPGCRALLDKGDVGATLQTAPRMMTAGNPNFDPPGGIRLLERTIAATDNAAAHYLLGAILANGERVPPRYAAARDHLTRAVAGGNPAAADLLALLWLRGQGGPQDIGKALELYETAVAGGFASGFNNLLEAYLTGRWTPPNPARVEALLTAAEAAGYPQIAQIRAQIAGAAKMINVQTIPPAGNGPPSYIAYKGFESPELPTPYIYELARRIAPTDPREARILYQLAAIRMIYDGERCADRTAPQGAIGWPPLMRQQMNFALTPVPDQAAVTAEVLAREAALPGDTVPVWLCYHGISGSQAGLAGERLEPFLVPAAQWPEIRAKTRQAAAASFASQ